MFIIYGCASPYYQKMKVASKIKKNTVHTKISPTKTSDLPPKKHRSTDPGRAYHRKTLNIAVLLIIYYHEIVAFVRSFSAVVFKE